MRNLRLPRRFLLARAAAFARCRRRRLTADGPTNPNLSPSPLHTRSGHKVLQEGQAKILMKGNEVFYNEAQVRLFAGAEGRAVTFGGSRAGSGGFF
jgi:hypothetical protein